VVKGEQCSLDLDTPPTRTEFGGDVGRGRRKQSRPFSSARPVHLVLRSTRAQQSLSLLRRQNQAAVTVIVNRAALRFGVTVYRMATVGNHVHMVIRAPCRTALQCFLRMAAGQIAQHVTLARRGVPFGKFWDQIAYSRLITWGREYAIVVRYVEQNLLEAMGVVPHRHRHTRRVGTADQSTLPPN
jgi:REP element-mobilizing transposase RayT